MAALSQAFLLALDATLADAWQTWPSLDEALERAHAAGVARFPTLVVPAQAFAAYLGARMSAPHDDPFPHADELYLACAVANGQPAALAAFERHYMPGVAIAVARFYLSTDELDELKQTMRRQLLMAESERPPRIVDYSGRGELGAWLRVAAVRAAIKSRRSRGLGAAEDDALEHVAAAEATPEMRYATEEHRSAFREALRLAIRSLEPQEQNVLRQHHLDELTLDQLGVLYRVHRTTVAYWLTRARERLFKRTRRALIEATRLSESDCDSLFRHAQSQFAVTLRSLFDA